MTTNRNRDVAPTERPGSMGPGSTVAEHPAFGQIEASRVSGGASLYGSDFLHQHYMTIRIQRSELHRDLNRDWPSAREELIEVALSEAQWATFVSSPNSGQGVQCTIEYVAGQRMPTIPLRKQEDVFRAELGTTLEAATKKVEATIAKIKGELGASIPGKKRDAILEHLDRLRRDLDDSLPFLASQFGEHMEDVVEKAKIEVGAYMQNAVIRAGLTALGAPQDLPLQLGSGEPPSPEEGQ